MEKIQRGVILLIIVMVFPFISPQAAESNLATREARQYFESLMTLVNHLTEIRASANKRKLHDSFCEESKSSISADELHNGLSRSDSLYDLRGIYPPKPQAVLKRNSVPDVMAFRKIAEVSASLTIGTWFNIGDRKVKNSVGEIWRFRHTNNGWCVVFG